MNETAALRIPARRVLGRKLLLAAAACMAVFGLVMWVLIIAMQAGRMQGQLIQHDSLQDYMAFYAAGTMVKEGRPGDMYDLGAVAGAQSDLTGLSISVDDSLPYLNPPFVAVAFAPLTLLSLGTATAVLFGLNVLLVGIGGVGLHRLTGPRDRAMSAFVWLAYLSAFSIFTLFLQLQLSMFAVLAWLGFIHFQRQGKDAWSGASLALGLVKPQLIVLPVLLLCLRRRYLALVPLATVGAVLTGVSIAVTGPDMVADYPRFLLESTSWEGQGIFAHGMFGWNALAADLSGDPTPSPFLVAVFVLPTLGLMFMGWRSTDGDGREILPLMGLTLTGVLLTNPHLYLPDLILVDAAIAMAAAHSMARGGRAGNWAAITVAFWFLMLPLPGMQTVPGGLPFLTVAMAALFVHFWLEVRHTTAAVTAAQPAATRGLAA